MLDSPRQPPARRVVPPVPVVLAVVLHINHAHPLVMSRRCGTLSTGKTLKTSTINNGRRCGTLSSGKTLKTSLSNTTMRNKNVDVICSTKR